MTGELRPIRGALTASLAARSGARTLVVPDGNAHEAALVDGVRVLGAGHLLAVTAHLAADRTLPATPAVRPGPGETEVADLSDIRGQHLAKRALEIAAAGAHSLLLIGPPGAGKTMLASRLPGILPPLTDEEALGVAAIHSAYKGFAAEQWKARPFRSPHHTASGVALVGGGSHPRPGEISLAHHGVLFLDELPEFDRAVLEVLREPLESGTITISRAARQAEFPARFQLVAAMNPCPCGYHGDASGRCRCTEERIRQYRAKVSGPLLDRIDMHVEVPAVPRDVLLTHNVPPVEGSRTVQARVIAARERQLARTGCANQALSNKQVEEFCRIDAPGQQLMEQAMQRLKLSARAYHRILKVARTVADLAGDERISTAHLAEAIQYRSLDRPVI